MSHDARDVLLFVRRVRRRRIVLAVIGDVAIGIVVLVAIAVIGRLLTRNSRGMQHEILLFGAMAIVVSGIAGLFRHWRGRDRAATEIERRAPQSRNVIATSAELLEAPGRSRPDVIELVTSRAADTVRSLDAARLFPLRGAIAKLAMALVFWAAAIGFTSRHDAQAPIVVGSGVPQHEVGTIRVTVSPPAYTKRPVQRLTNPTRVDAIAGSRIALSVRGADVRVETVEGEVHPTADGDYALTAQEDGFIAIRAGASARKLIGLTVTPDQVPRVRVTVPGKDMFISEVARRIPVEMDARDDIGLTALELRYTKVSGSGERFTFTEGTFPIAIDRANETEWSAKGSLDLASLELEPGDMVVYRAAAADGRPGGVLTESDAFIVEITTPLSIPAEGFSVDDLEDKYAVSQQMVILKTERLLARAASLPPDSLEYYSQTIAAEQRAVRAEFVFMMGGEVAQDVVDAAADLDETREAQGESEIAAGRLLNRGRVALVEAIRLMSQANARLNNVDPKGALPEEKAALVALQQAFSRTRYLLRALTQRERLDLSRRLTGVLTLAGRDAQPRVVPPVDPAVMSLRRSLAAIAALSNGPADRAEASRIAQDVLSVDPSDSTLQLVAARLSESKLDAAASALADALRARLPREATQGESPELRRLRGALSDALNGRRGR